MIVVDLGTATTFDAITAQKEYLGGAIIAGLRLSMESLESQTAKLPSVEIVPCTEALGRSTVESIQSGLYFGHLGQIKELSRRISQECFGDAESLLIGTGGFSSLFEKEKVFHSVHADLVLLGIVQALKMNS